MRRLFVQFYLMLMACFLGGVLLVGVVYKQAVDKVGERYLSDLLGASLSMIQSELKGVPPEMWSETLEEFDHGLTFPLRIEGDAAYTLDDDARAALARGEIVMLEDNFLFLQRIPNSNFLLVAGPLRYLFFLHQLKWVDYVLLLLVGLSLGIPVLLWLRPHWNQLMQLEQTAVRLAEGDLSARVQLPPGSGVRRVGEAFNRMADSIGALLAGRKALIDAVAHELRTPLARLRYRLALLEGDPDSPPRQAIERDLAAIDSLLQELLLHARLDRPQVPLTLSRFDAREWVAERLAEQAPLASGIDWRDDSRGEIELEGDRYLLSRALDNLLSNARRYAQRTVRVQLEQDADDYCLRVDDDGPGIPAEERERVLEPFVRLDQSRGRDSGGHGLGLSIVQGIARAHQGTLGIEDSPLGGARFVLRWPGAAGVHSVTQGNIPLTDAGNGRA
ncbi:sensor protein RstB [Pseudogulbenkiania sp. NH8B]|uniref:two-component system sensor histidine kinase RstB n=1 Tax=Pseudogulbenkiania sp. (strain NH8B) TaxID=748280 RepID=UPI00022794DC|nr:two-component system sensor histidine kinase RstB [Pseudogulbenkiania sp. NH8B]BAK75356.1 sensor protein RstB [Pseudogulbenkiania sp. NH8B]